MCNHIEEHNHEHEGCHGHCHENEHENSKLGIVLYVLSIILFAIGYIPAFEQYKMFIYLGAVLLSGYDLIFEGLKNILKLNFEEDTLMTIAFIAAFGCVISVHTVSDFISVTCPSLFCLASYLPI